MGNPKWRYGMSSEDLLPEECQGCVRPKTSRASENCDFCRKTDFYESVLCDLNRSVQNPDDFSCYAFLPSLKLVSPIHSRPVKSESYRKADKNLQAEEFQRIVFSEKYRYEKALSFQKLNKDPDLVLMNLNFHFAWNVVHRKPLFSPEKKYFGFVYDTLLRCSDLVEGFFTLIWLAPDHVHVYVESNGQQPPETQLKRMKGFLKKEVLKEFPDICDGTVEGRDLWDEAYFVETVG